MYVFSEILKSVILRHCKKCKVLEKVIEKESKKIRCETCSFKLLFKCILCSSSFYCLKVTQNHVLKFHKQAFLKNNNVPTKLVSYVGTINSQSDKEVNDQANKKLICKNNSKVSLFGTISNEDKKISDFNCKFCSFNVKYKLSLKEHLIKKHKDKFERAEELEGIIDDSVTLLQPPSIGIVNLPVWQHARFLISLIILFNQACFSFLFYSNFCLIFY